MGGIAIGEVKENYIVEAENEKEAINKACEYVKSFNKEGEFEDNFINCRATKVLR